MTDIEMRIFHLEQLQTRIDYALRDLKNQLTDLGNKQRQMSPGGQGQGGGPAVTFYWCNLAAALLAGQTVPNVTILNSAGTSVGTASVNNNTANDLNPGMVILGRNADGTYNAVTQPC
jgi:hypothetical protein